MDSEEKEVIYSGDVYRGERNGVGIATTKKNGKFHDYILCNWKDGQPYGKTTIGLKGSLCQIFGQFENGKPVGTIKLLVPKLNLYSEIVCH